MEESKPELSKNDAEKAYNERNEIIQKFNKSQQFKDLFEEVYYMIITAGDEGNPEVEK